MPLTIPLTELTEGSLDNAGGKAVGLGHLHHQGLRVPRGICITCDAYVRYLMETGLESRIVFELQRKAFDDMRWEEIWDASLRIRNLFQTTPIPTALRDQLTKELQAAELVEPLAVRSSAPAEDAAESSFAGLHESFINVSGMDRILTAVKGVWASLWSDRALLYRQELGLDVDHSAIAVVVQELVCGDASGVAFSQAPANAQAAVVEAVHGLNDALVDGSLEPDAWMLARNDGRILNHHAPEQRQRCALAEEGVGLEPLPDAIANQPPVSEKQLQEIWNAVMGLEQAAAAPQDMEWTWARDGLVLLQARPITTAAAPDPNADDQRAWYCSLTRSLTNLKKLRTRIEDDILPAMDAAAKELAQTTLDNLNKEQLAAALDEREAALEHWRQVYWDEFIPFAHGMRLFAQIYNDVLQPDDPYEFTKLLTQTRMISVERNQKLQQFAKTVASDSDWVTALRDGRLDALPPKLQAEFEQLVAEYGDLFRLQGTLSPEQSLARVIATMAAAPRTETAQTSAADLDDAYLAAFPDAARDHAAQLLDLARASCRLRDDDNIYLGRIEARVVEARQELECRQGALAEPANRADADEVHAPSNKRRAPDVLQLEPNVRPRQLVGQPASQGIAIGPARVVRNPADIFDVQAGDILVCDAIDPAMTFAVPLAAAIVERRGGMLIHGAIIAREYAIPCVTGIPNATEQITTGTRLCVDGHLGIVTVNP